MKWSIMDYVTATLVVLAGINLGVVGLFDYNIIETVAGTGTALRVVEGIVGLAAIWMAFTVTRAAVVEDATMAEA